LNQIAAKQAKSNRKYDLLYTNQIKLQLVLNKEQPNGIQKDDWRSFLVAAGQSAAPFLKDLERMQLLLELKAPQNSRKFVFAADISR